MPGTIHAFDFLAQSSMEPSAVIPVFGSDRYLRSQVVHHLVHQLTGSTDDDDYAATRFDGDQAQWFEVYDELTTVSLFGGGPRIVVVNDADKFVKNHRDNIAELLAANPGNKFTLIICVKSWPANTKLYKTIDKSGIQIEADPPVTRRGKSKSRDDGKIADWIISQGAQNDLKFTKKSARQMLDLVGDDFGRIETELAKIALLRSGKTVSEQDVVEIVGGWKAKSIWDAVDRATDGETGEALVLLNRILMSGEHPLSLYGQLSWSLRRYGQAYEHFSRAERQGDPISLRESLQRAGFRSWGGELENAERRMKTIGRGKISQISRKLLEIDLQLKGTHSRPERAGFALEMLFAEFGKQKTTGVA